MKRIYAVLLTPFSGYVPEHNRTKKKGERRSTIRVRCATSLALFFAALVSRYSAVDLKMILKTNSRNLKVV